ncbi:MAG: hypothetical protein ABR974_01205 [Bacteroidales bacterium]|jgi:hypothetical protein
MAKQIKYIVEKELVRVWFDGFVSAESIASIITDIVNERKNLPDNVRVLVDARRAKYDGKPDDLKMILRKFREHNRKFEMIKLAIILQNPYETAISIIMQEMLKNIENIFFKVCSTEQAAISWLR